MCIAGETGEAEEYVTRSSLPYISSADYYNINGNSEISSRNPDECNKFPKLIRYNNNNISIAHKVIIPADNPHSISGSINTQAANIFSNQPAAENEDNLYTYILFTSLPSVDVTPKYRSLCSIIFILHWLHCLLWSCSETFMEEMTAGIYTGSDNSESSIRYLSALGFFGVLVIFYVLEEIFVVKRYLYGIDFCSAVGTYIFLVGLGFGKFNILQIMLCFVLVLNKILLSKARNLLVPQMICIPS